MQLLEEAIRNRGAVYPGNILKVDGFLNHQIDPDILRAIGEEVFRLYKDAGVTKILTIEASGIAIAAICAQFFNVPMVFAKKSATSNIAKTVYKTTVHSYTHNRDYEVLVSKDYLKADDVVLIIDDFLSNGAALTGLIDLVSQAGATLAGAAIAIEKRVQPGGNLLRAKGIRIESLAVVESMDDGKIVFARD